MGVSWLVQDLESNHRVLVGRGGRASNRPALEGRGQGDGRAGAAAGEGGVARHEGLAQPQATQASERWQPPAAGRGVPPPREHLEGAKPCETSISVRRC